MRIAVISIISLLLLFSVGPVIGATEIFIDYNFNEPVKKGLILTKSAGVGGVHKKLTSALLEDLPGESGNRALRLTRDGLKFVHIQRTVSIPKDYDYEISLRCNLGEKGSYMIAFYDADKKPIGALYFQRNRLLVEKKKWVFSGIRTPKNQWFTLKINFDTGAKNYKIKLINLNGQSVSSIPIPFLSKKPFQRISFSTCPPEGSSVLLDDLKVTYNPERVVANRVDALDGAEIFIRNNDGSSTSFPMLNDGDIRASAISHNIPLELNIDLAKPTKVSTIRLYGGDPECYKFPSGTCRPLKYTIRGLNAAGQWRKLASRKVSEKTLKDGTPESIYQQEDFPPMEVSKLEIVIDDSSDTLKRVSGKTAKKKSIALREIGLWGVKLSAKSNQDNQFKKSIYGEFRLPVYQKQSVAGLHLHNDRQDKKTHRVRIELRERYSNKLVQKARALNLKYGNNIIEFELEKLPDGEYTAAVIDQNDSQKRGRKFRRLLRLQRLGDKVDHDPPINQMSGKKIFFPDAHYLEKYSNIKFSGTQAKVEQAIKPDSLPDGFVRHGYQVFFDTSGRMCLPFYTVDRLWSKKSKKNFIAVRSDKNKSKWTISKLTPSSMSKKIQHESPLKSLPSAAAKPDWSIKCKNGKTPVFRFYDPQRDGKVNLNQVRFENTRRYSGKSILGPKEKLLDWKIITPPPSSIWPIWYKAPGEAILLTKTPLLQDGRSRGEFEDLKDSNDNTVGQWLSDDGKTLSYARGRLLKRYPPFIAPYDNLASVSRIISIISTTDGINWKYSYMIPPDKSDPPVAQHYGALVFRVPYGNGLMQAFVYRYRARSQQISVELAYSWDGANWYRYSGQPAFVENGKPGSWNSGMIMISSSAVAHNGVVYQMLSWVCQGFHFYDALNSSNIKEVSGARVKKYFSGKNLESWPFFKHFGGYDGIAADIRKAGISVGIASYREGGLFFMSTKGADTGRFVSRPITASNGMSANVSISKGGFLSIDLINKSGKVIPGYTKQLSSSDNINMLIFKNLPKAPFKIRAKLKNTKLFSFNF